MSNQEKITLTQGQLVEGTGYYVFETGEYSKTDLVPCSKSLDSATAEVAFQANYILTGEHA